MHVAGYFGQAEGWSLTEYNKLQMKRRFVYTIFGLLNLRVFIDIVSFFGLLASDPLGYRAGTGKAIGDLACWLISAAVAFCGCVYTTGTPFRIFSVLAKIQRQKLMVVATTICCLLGIAATNKAIKLFPIFCVAAIAFPALTGVVEAAAEGQKRVVSV